MTLNELYDLAIKHDYLDLQALIMFLVYEKKVLKMEDDSSELDLYFLEKHKERMNKELHAYKAKLGMEYSPRVYKFIKNDSNFMYVFAKSLDQSKFLISRQNYQWNEIKIVDEQKGMDNGLTLKEITEGKEPTILGGL